MPTGPSINRFKSKQDYATPKDFIDAVTGCFGPIAFDLAADATNTKAARYYDKERNSLKQSWHKLSGNLWLNPEFGDIAPWARKCAAEKPLLKPESQILLLVPASVDSEWWASFVHRKALVLFLRPRLSFDGLNPYPKATALCVYNPLVRVGYKLWRWK